LLGSDWARENPNKLPYSTCYLTSAFKNTPNSNYEMSLIGGYEASEGGIFFLECKTVPFGKYPEGLAFDIPLGPLSGLKMGLMASMSLGARNNYFPVFSVKNLHEKQYKDIFSVYQGFELSLHIVPGAAFSSMTNAQGIQVNKTMYGVGLGFTLGYIDLLITPFSQKNFISSMCTNHYVLLEDTVTTSSRTPEECTQMSNRAAFGQPLFPYAKDKYTTQGIHLLPLDGDLEFIKIK
jgi:hypothetical protein